VAIECDGHDFHEKTKEQARKDKRRDRVFLAEGLPVLRFTGSEIHRDPTAIAKEVGEVLLAELKRGGRVTHELLDVKSERD
jgi:very-short-patch-repair endonuclease